MDITTSTKGRTHPSNTPPPMARLLLVPPSIANGPARAGLGAAVAFILCAVALAMCASHARRWRRLGALHRHGPSGPVIQLDMDSRILTTKRVHQAMIESGQDAMSGPQLCVWQKNILMGEKCQLPDFSGVIVYDSTGNLVPPATPRIKYTIQ